MLVHSGEKVHDFKYAENSRTRLFSAYFKPISIWYLRTLILMQQPAEKFPLQVYSTLQQYGSNFGRHGKYVSALTQHFYER